MLGQLHRGQLLCLQLIIACKVEGDRPLVLPVVALASGRASELGTDELVGLAGALLVTNKGLRSCGGPCRNASSGLTSVFRTAELRLLQNFRQGSALRTSLSWTMHSFGAVAPSPLRFTDPLNRFTAPLVHAL